MLPDFIGIGAQRSGSTWLASNLKQHPDLWLTPVKELHYFDAKSVGLPEGVWSKFVSRQWPQKRYRKKILVRLKAKTKSCKASDWAWDYRFFFKPQGDEWYASLFDQAKGKCAGEITPAYAVLDDSDVAKISELMPHLKILFVLRNPIDRVWSQAVKEFSRHKKRDLKLVTESEWEETFNAQRVLQRSDYLRTLDVWGNYFPQDQIFVGLYDDIVGRPKELLLDVYRFLGVRSSEEFLPPGLGEIVNAGARTSIPTQWEKYLARQYYDQICTLNERLQGKVTGWQVRSESLL